MVGIKIKYFISKIKRIIWIGLLIVFIVIMSLNHDVVKSIFTDVDTNTIGLIGALFGALIGGLISFAGSIWVHNRQLKSMAEIRRKEEIYMPLYNELKRLEIELFELDKFPNMIVVDSKYIKAKNFPKYQDWYEIKNSTKYLELSNDVKDKMSSLEDDVHQYNVLFGNANKELENIWTRIIDKNMFSFGVFPSFYALKDILDNKKVEYFEGHIYPKYDKPKGSDYEELKALEKNYQILIERAVQESSAINTLRAKYCDIRKLHKEVMLIIEFVIKTTIYKYEM